jgi:hypothetical protein
MKIQKVGCIGMNVEETRVLRAVESARHADTPLAASGVPEITR